MLINLTNHPASQWPENQVKAAQKYGEIVDIPFPDIPPGWSEGEIQELVKEYFGLIKKVCKEKGEKVFVHIMGELSFTFALSSVLIKEGFTCIVSTAKRDAIENNNLKITKFRFIRFRELFIQL